jgi:hypothetical protein
MKNICNKIFEQYKVIVWNFQIVMISTAFEIVSSLIFLCELGK